MAAIRTELRIEGGSFEPLYWVFLDGDTGQLLDLTTPGFNVSGEVYAGDGNIVLQLVDADFQRTDAGRVYFAPSSATSEAWGFSRAFCQIYLAHPSGRSVRFQDSQFNVSPKI